MRPLTQEHSGSKGIRDFLFNFSAPILCPSGLNRPYRLSMPSKYAIQFAFDGTDYCGWQKQNGIGKHANPKPSIEEKLVEAVTGVSGEEVTVVASGRTDAGVHSNGQVAHFTLATPRELDQHFINALNAHLPESIRVLRAGPVADSFKAQRAVKKQYSYYFQQGPANLPHLRNITMWNRRSLDTGRMNEAVQHLIGQHDFFPFCGQVAKVHSTVREIFEASVTEEPIRLPGLSNAEANSATSEFILVTVARAPDDAIGIQCSCR